MHLNRWWRIKHFWGALRKKWTTYQVSDNEVHVIPLGDTLKHTIEYWEDSYDIDCICRPQTQPVEREHDGTFGWLVVHKAIDGRE